MLAPMNASPSPSLVANLRAELQRHAPFAQMPATQVDRFVATCTQAYYEPGGGAVAGQRATGRYRRQL